MGAFNTAGRDPIFWLHHCNIDRLWEKWLSQDAGRSNPTSDSTWMNQTFTFVDESKQFAALSGSEVLYIASQLKYQYDDPNTCTPLLALLSPVSLVTAMIERTVISSFVLARDISLPPQIEPFAIRLADAPSPERLLKSLEPEFVQRVVDEGRTFTLAIEDLRTREAFNGFYEIYVGLPSGQSPSATSPYYVGNLTLFGADEHSRAQTSQHGDHGGGLMEEIDVTNAVRRLAEGLNVR